MHEQVEQAHASLAAAEEKERVATQQAAEQRVKTAGLEEKCLAARREIQRLQHDLEGSVNRLDFCGVVDANHFLRRIEELEARGTMSVLSLCSDAHHRDVSKCNHRHA